MRELLKELLVAASAGRATAWCTVVETRGSTPQKAGATMLVFPDGRQAGTLGGGCIEAEVRQRALRLLGELTPRATVQAFSLEDNYGWDDGLICGGKMTILVDPLIPGDPSVGEYVARMAALVDSGRGGMELLNIDGEEVGGRRLFDPQHRLVAQRSCTAVFDSPDILPNLRSRPRPSLIRGYAILPILPRGRVLIVGAGHVGQAVAKLAAEVDFDVWVIDDRERYANAERFPQAERLIVGDIGESLKSLNAGGDVDFRTYALIVTRGHNHDEEALYHLAGSDAGFVGMIGSKRKVRLIMEDLEAKGVPDAALQRVHAPLGFDIGSQTVPEIAVSIVAQLIAVRNLGVDQPEARSLGRKQAHQSASTSSASSVKSC